MGQAPPPPRDGNLTPTGEGWGGANTYKYSSRLLCQAGAGMHPPRASTAALPDPGGCPRPPPPSPPEPPSPCKTLTHLSPPQAESRPVSVSSRVSYIVPGSAATARVTQWLGGCGTPPAW